MSGQSSQLPGKGSFLGAAKGSRKEDKDVAEYPLDEKTSFDGKKVKVLGPTFEEGKPETPINWRRKLRNRDEMLAYLKTGERYWFSDEWYGSEKRKTKA